MNYAKRDNKKFVNPYNFVELKEACAKHTDYKESKKDAKAITGWLECTLDLKSPIFIPNSSESNYFDKAHNGGETPKSYEFFSYENLSGRKANGCPGPNKPVIPGSEIRGMIRSAFEALTNSCMSTSDFDFEFHKRAPKSGKSGLPGLLVKVNGEWKLEKCDRYMIQTSHCRNDRLLQSKGNNLKETLKAIEKSCKPIWVKLGGEYVTSKRFTLVKVVEDFSTSTASPGANWKQGFVHVTAKIGNKHHDSVFVPQGVYLPIRESDVRNYISNLKMYKDNEEYGKEYNHLFRSDNPESYDYTPVFYSEYKKGEYYLSPSMISREVFHKNLRHLIGSYSPCTDHKKLCKGCNLFGMVSDSGSVSSRLRFSDATVAEGCIPEYCDPVFLDELASPKPSATEFYLKRPNEQHMWNYDYAFSWQVNDKKKLTSTVNVEKNYKAVIRGRKFYWHHRDGIFKTLSDVGMSAAELKQKQERAVFVRPLKSASFSFKVFFDRVSEGDLARLIWVLSIGFKVEHAHKIGMGKPIGLGSVQINVIRRIKRSIFPDGKRQKSQVRYLDNPGNSESVTKLKANELGCSEDAYKQFMDLTCLDKVKHPISYPYVIEIQRADLATARREEIAPEHYKWFVGNRQITGTANNPVINQPLAETDNPEMVVIVMDHNRR